MEGELLQKKDLPFLLPLLPLRQIIGFLMVGVMSLEAAVPASSVQRRIYYEYFTRSYPEAALSSRQTQICIQSREWSVEGANWVKLPSQI